MTTKWIGEDGRPHDHTSFCTANGCTPVPATPAPSQPAGAREQVMKALDWWQHSNLSIPPIAWNALCTARDALLDAAQQTAAKDAAYERLAEATVADLKALKVDKEAAERERDSLRAELERALDMKRNGAGNEFWDEWEINADAALKAGKEGNEARRLRTRNDR